MTDHGTPITEALGALKLTAEECATIFALTHVRTVGDLLVVLERDELPKALAAKLKKALG